MKTFQYQCAYCDKKYKREEAFLKHECNEMIRTQEIKTNEGQRAYSYYKDWNDIRRYSIPDEKTFITSPHYLAFMRFEKFVRSVRLPAPKEYIKLMVKKTMTPKMWTNNLAYKHYIEYMDRRMSPMRQANVTVQSIFEFCEKHDIDTSEYFDTITPNELIQCVVRRQISPWILFNSKKFLKFYMEDFSEGQRSIFDGIHSPSKWKEKFDKRESSIKEIKKIVDELEL